MTSKRPNLRKITTPIAAIIVIVFAVVVVNYPGLIDNTTSSNQSAVCFDDNCFQVELAITPEKMSQGLMHRESMDYDKGIIPYAVGLKDGGRGIDKTAVGIPDLQIIITPRQI